MTQTVDIESRYDLPADAPRQLTEQGYVRLPRLLDPATIAHYGPIVSDEVLRLNTMHLPMAQRDTYNKAFLQVTNLWQQSEKVRELVFSKRIARVAAQLLGVDGVRLYHDQALYKEPGGGVTPWHADQYYWPLATDRTITVWIPLQDTPAELGPLEFARGSHRFSRGRDLPISDASERRLQRELAAEGFEVDSAGYAAGDASFHLGWTFHHAGPNRSTAPRRVMTMIYMDADVTVSEPTNDNQRADRDAFLPGVPVGEVPDTDLTPELYRA